jgi:hypothetical protein
VSVVFPSPLWIFPSRAPWHKSLRHPVFPWHDSAPPWLQRRTKSTPIAPQPSPRWPLRTITINPSLRRRPEREREPHPRRPLFRHRWASERGLGDEVPWAEHVQPHNFVRGRSVACEFVTGATSSPRRRLASWSDLTTSRNAGTTTTSVFATSFYVCSTPQVVSWTSRSQARVVPVGRHLTPGGGAAVRSLLSGARISEPLDESGTICIRLQTYCFGLWSGAVDLMMHNGDWIQDNGERGKQTVVVGQSIDDQCWI